MKAAYLYVRVSTDEQKKRGYSLPEQEDRLIKYCRYNNIEIKGIFREDFSAKNFNRPEWKKLVLTIKNRSKEDKNILFIKWDRFSRNIEYAYEMIGMLRRYRTTAMAIDQPIDFSVPESTVILAVYLSVPEAENSRRALNTANGIRRAKQMGRYPSKAPIGFINLTTLDGKKIIVQKQPEASIIKWVFDQLAKNLNKIEVVRKTAHDKGLKCSKSHFFRLVRNPAYCGLIQVRLNADEQYLVKGIHDPLISKALFYEVQHITLRLHRGLSKILSTKRHIKND
ncbi:recombinase family protein [Pedobacter sp. MC2016-14]|uniref:recombinase family protein n=1 Tax=Pedobacter sp. MC2016-14 TaxID=2897327 RepID=UPI001E58ADE5|nr:recombinase family protein [Pedobacter sp. MC2016-14]MCD0489967.1 recombinase family protein [Pedobacter sp. MC2016-14]